MAPMEMHERLAIARKLAGYETPTDAARALGVPEPTYLGHENGSRGLSRAGPRYADFFHVSLDWLLNGKGQPRPGVRADLAVDYTRTAPDGTKTLGQVKMRRPNASAPEPAPLTSARLLPVWGEGAGGPNGRFVLNGRKVRDVLCPPTLEHVPNAYAVYVHGDSMEPRYYSGEIVFVDPHRPVRRGDFVVAQLREEEGEPPSGYVKKFISRNSRELVLEQLNPPEDEEAVMRFPADQVISIHKIVLGGEA